MINIISDMEMHYISIYFLFDSYYIVLYEMHKWGTSKWDTNNFFNYIHFVYVIIYCNAGIPVFTYCMLLVCVYIVAWEEFNEQILTNH